MYEPTHRGLPFGPLDSPSFWNELARCGVCRFGRFIPIPRKVVLKRWTEGYLPPGEPSHFLPKPNGRLVRW